MELRIATGREPGKPSMRLSAPDGTTNVQEAIATFLYPIRIIGPKDRFYVWIPGSSAPAAKGRAVLTEPGFVIREDGKNAKQDAKMEPV